MRIFEAFARAELETPEAVNIAALLEWVDEEIAGTALYQWRARIARLPALWCAGN